jgi:ABC-type lipoprotein release transport system permease subunit
MIAVAVGVAFAVLLISVSAGVSYGIHHRLASTELRRLPGVDVPLIDSILTALTVVVTAAMLAQTAISTFVLGVTAMRSRREEIAIRRQSGVLRSALVAEFILAVMRPCLVGGLAGEAAGLGIGVLLRRYTVLEVRFTVVSLLAAFPITVLLAVAATIWPAWQAANVSPALLRRE